MKGKFLTQFFAFLCLGWAMATSCSAQSAKVSQDGSSQDGSSQDKNSGGGDSAELLPPAIATIVGKTMGTTYQVKLRALSSDGRPLDLKKLQADIENRLAEINLAMSTYIPDSEISKLNRHQSTEQVSISKDFATVLQKAIAVSQSTGGRFDITVGPLVRFWGFGGGTKPETVPTEKEIAKVLARTGANRLNVGEGTVQKNHPELEVDLSAIAKGFAVDEVAKLVTRYSPDVLVEVGGEVFAVGSNPTTGNPWAIGVEVPSSSPLDLSRKMAARVELSGQALATSGDYRNQVVIAGRKFQHTIDPKTGFPVDNGIHSVSVVATDCMTADALATGFMVCSLDEIKSLCKSIDAGVFVIYDAGEGQQAYWNNDQFQGQILDPVSKDENLTENSTTNPNQATSPIYLVIGTIIVFGLAISGMAIGVILSNRQLKGSCGGLSAMAGKEQADASPCSLCTKPASECSKRSDSEKPEGSVSD